LGRKGYERLRLNSKVWPIDHPHPAFPEEKYNWAWILNVKLIYRHSPPTAWFEAFVDSGSPWCLFHASLCRPLGMELEGGVRDDLGGIIQGPKVPMYFHRVKVVVGLEQFETMAGFSWGLTVGGILGRRGFFDNFNVSFDSSADPPTIELMRTYRV